MKKNITIAELAWLAGIIDGEGSIFIMKQGRKDRERSFNYILRISVQSADTIMAEECFNLTERGDYYFNKTTKENQSNTFKWQANGKNAIHVLREVLPYLKVKKEQAEAAITFQETTKKHWKLMKDTDYQRQEDFYYKLKQLKIDLKVGKDTIEYQSANRIFRGISDKRAVQH